MGYRSDVLIKCEKNAFDKIKKAYKSVDFPPEVIRRGGYYYLKWSHVKWYPEFDFVKAIENVLDDLDEEKDEAYSFIRIGEDMDDNECRENSYDLDFYIIRTVNDWPKTKKKK